MDRAGPTVAFVWGLAEATFFFVVPDVWLTWIVADRTVGAGLRACLWALLGALAGGCALYAWGSLDPEGVVRLLDWVPAVSEPMLDEARRSLEAGGARAMLAGPLGGVPFKIFAAQANAAGVGFGAFLAIAPIARLPRFVIATLVAWLVLRRVMASATVRTRRLVLTATWCGFYVVYFSVMPN